MRHYSTLSFRLPVLMTVLLALLCLSCNRSEKQWHIGVSQCSEDIWRNKQNRELTIGGYANNNVYLEFLSAEDNDQRQIEQVRHFIEEKVDLLIVAPNQASTLSAVVDEAYDRGIPVILFDRKTNSDKYTAYMGADNYEIGHTMGHLIAEQMERKGTLVEITGLKGSSPAIERHRGFLEALADYPDIQLVSSELGDWTELSGRAAMEEILRLHPDLDIDCLFGHNDRLAMGARQVAMEHGQQDIRYYGVDALPTPGGGIDLVLDGILQATYIYPTQGLELTQLALRILNGQPFERNNLLHSAVVDIRNAELLKMQYREQQRVSGELETVHRKLDTYFSQVNVQRKVITFFLLLVVLIMALSVIAFRAYVTKSRLNEELQQLNVEQQQLNQQLEQRNDELQQLYKQLEDMADARLVFFTNVGHKLRTPLTLIAGPTEQLAADKHLKGPQRQLVEMMHRNLERLKQLVDEILDFRKIGTEQLGDLPEEPAAPASTTAGRIVEATDKPDGELPEVLVVDDNPDVRLLVKTLLQEHFHVTLAANGKEGLKEARRIVPDLIVSDVMMPVMDGLEMCSEVKRDPVTCHIPVLMLTARTLEEQRVEGYAHGADAYITKPFTASVLTARIANLLASRRTLRRVFSKGLTAEKPVAVPAADDRDSNFVERLRGIIQQHLADADFSVERIGEEIGMSRVQLYRKTKALTGLSPVELLRKSRVEKARRLLETTDKSISEIAYDTGFSAPSYFAKCFKDEYGKSPGEWRS